MSGPVLRPLSLGEILDVSFGLYRNLFLPLVVVALVTRAVPLAVSVYVQSSGGMFTNLPLYLGSVILDVVLAAIAAAASTFIVSESYMGRRLTAGDAFRRSTPFVGRLIALGILTGLVVMLGFLLLIIPGIILACGLALATPAMVIESLGSSTEAMGRSWALTRNFRGKIFVALLVVGVLMYLPFIALGGIAAVSLGAGGVSGSGAFVGITGLAALLSSLIWPLFYCVLTVAYYDLRVRKEAFDLEILAAGLAKT
ncbi:MAG TPA: YciC family protein [Gemmatimonadales bacterium]|nr:YciC family protein [Gemmatimonadales bacterium]